MDGAVSFGAAFFNDWAWLMFVGVGLVLMILELIVGIETGLDLVFIGTALVLGGLITLALHSWVWTALASGIISVIYVLVGRGYIHRRTAVAASKTNIDLIIGKHGVVQKEIIKGRDGLVRVGNEEWRARSDEAIGAGQDIVVMGISGVTLNVKKAEGD